MVKMQKSAFRQGQRRRMDKFSLGEVSFVDRPAQETALATIQKFNPLTQDEKDLKTMLAKLQSFPTPEEGETQANYVERMTKDVAKSAEFPDQNELTTLAHFAFMQSINKNGELSEDLIKRGDLVALFTSSTNGHEHGISIHGSGEDIHMMMHYAAGPDDEHMHDHQIVRMTDGSYSVSENRGHTHTIDTNMLNSALLACMAKSNEEESSSANLLEKEKSSRSNSPKEATMTKEDDLKKAQERATALEAENAILKTISEFTSTQKAYFDNLDVELDDDARKAFIDADTAKRNEIVAKAEADAKDSDPVVFKAADGTEYRKSDGEKVINLAKQYDQDRKENILIRKSTEDASLTKRAEGELANLPGDLDVRKAILKAVDGIEDEGVREKAHDALKAHNAKLASAFTEVGSSGAPSIEKSEGCKGAEDKLDKLAKDMAAKDNVDFYTAYEKVSEANLQLLSKAVGN